MIFMEKNELLYAMIGKILRHSIKICDQDQEELQLIGLTETRDIIKKIVDGRIETHKITTGAII